MHRMQLTRVPKPPFGKATSVKVGRMKPTKVSCPEVQHRASCLLAQGTTARLLDAIPACPALAKPRAMTSSGKARLVPFEEARRAPKTRPTTSEGSNAFPLLPRELV